MSGDGGVFAVIEVFADLGGSVDPVIEVGDERCDRPLEVDIVFPQGIVCIDQQRIAWISAREVGEMHHEIIIGGAERGSTGAERGDRYAAFPRL